MQDPEFLSKIEHQKRWEEQLRHMAETRPPRTTVLPPVPLVWPIKSGDLKHAFVVRRSLVFHKKLTRCQRLYRWFKSRLFKETDGPTF